MFVEVVYPKPNVLNFENVPMGAVFVMSGIGAWCKTEPTRALHLARRTWHDIGPSESCNIVLKMKVEVEIT